MGIKIDYNFGFAFMSHHLLMTWCNLSILILHMKQTSSIAFWLLGLLEINVTLSLLHPIFLKTGSYDVMDNSFLGFENKLILKSRHLMS